MVGVVTGISAAAVAAGAAIGGLGLSAYELSQQGGAISAENQTQQDALGLAKTTQSEQEYYNNLLQTLIANPSSVSSLPGFSFDLSTGAKAVTAGLGPGGFAGSGNEGAALTQFGQGLATSFYGQQTSLLASLSGVTAASSPAQAIGASTSANALSTNTLSSLLNSLGFFGTLAGKGLGSGAPAGTPAALTSGGGGLSTGGGGGYIENLPGVQGP